MRNTEYPLKSLRHQAVIDKQELSEQLKVSIVIVVVLLDGALEDKFGYSDAELAILEAQVSKEDFEFRDGKVVLCNQLEHLLLSLGLLEQNIQARIWQ